MTYAQLQRLAFIDWRMLTAGSIRREHISKTFSVSMARASGDIQAFIAAYPDAISYDKSALQYVPAGRYRSVTGWTQAGLRAWKLAHQRGVSWAWG